jgi:hypothetical protein
MSRRSVAVLLLAATAPSCARGADRASPASTAPSTPTLVPPVPEKAEAAVRRIESRDDVPLRGLRVDAKKGDWLVEGPSEVAVVSAATGGIVDFGARGGEDALVFLEPTVFLGLDAMTSVVESIGPPAPAATAKAVLVRRRVLSDPPMTLWTYVTLAQGALRIESVATTQSQPALAVTLGEVVAWGNVPTWVEGHGFAEGPGSWAGAFLAREGFGVSYALSVEGAAHVLARFGATMPGFFESARTGERVESIPADGASQRRLVLLTQAGGLGGNAALKLPPPETAALERWALPPNLAPRSVLEVRSCAGAAFARFAADAEAVELPSGCWRARLSAPGYAPGPWVDPPLLVDAAKTKSLPRAGTLHWAVRARGAGVIPARILVRGVGNPDPDWGTDPLDGASLNVIHADHDGERPIPPGRYRVTVSRGLEYTQDVQTLVVEEGHAASLSAELARVVDTTGWISADLHVHANPSPDAPAPLPDRVSALAAAGVEVAVATDHNAVTDYAPTIRERGLGEWLASVVGDEVTTRGVLMGHFNVFPLAAGSEPVAFDHVSPAALVASARAAAPAGAQRIVQMNHPRMGSIGYLELLRFDPRDVAGWRARSPLGELGFDAIEVFNGDHYAAIDEVESVLSDWYALLNAGVRMTATGNSDSHRITYHEAGVPRNFVQMGQVGDDSPSRFDEARFVEAVRAGRVIVSSGPFVRLEVAGRGVGEEAPSGEDEVHVAVDAPDWVDISKVDVVVRGQTVQSYRGPFHGSPHRLDTRFVAAMKPGDWVVAVVRGDRPMDYLARPGAKPFAFTNPVWIK